MDTKRSELLGRQQRAVPRAPEADGPAVRDRLRAVRPAAVVDRPEVPPLPEICRTVADSIPYSLYGEERLHFLADQVRVLPDREKTALRLHVEFFVRHMLEVGASDIDAGGPACNGFIWYRVDGDKRPDERMGRYHVDETNVLFLNLLTERQREVLFEEGAVDFSFQLPVEGRDGRPRRFRATLYYDMEHLGLNMRAISDELRSLRSLGFHPIIEHGVMFRHVRDGLTLVTGVTGSGKSTTLDAIVDANNKDFPGHIVIIGKPIEYMHVSKMCIVRHREVGNDVRTFKDGIVQALRQDPDIVVIGEMRDPETISAALEITDSGHKVFSTLHTSSAVESIDRIIGEYPPEEQNRVRNRLADVLRCVVSQKLCPKVGGGRVLAKEVLWMTPSVRAAIKNENTNEIYQMMWEGGNQGQITLEQDLFRLMRQGLITAETAMNYANNKRRLQQLMGS
ncbi:PilT/PilU family type 4a pilus ATPase [Rhodocaloribacter litoris]|uniref:type IV pilus twitching motility protein PilT n=1 Tax=Rhodocaloribacter litoris TaxID=2558931 RepID=UPI00141FB893|nr:PilT/PilU family type 4a pilus ATPase [Rhodocaloribacter litoris]QXD15235.1 PilT/PilU family type 4a pilus ATPase [Rhodocaloribacter litoris]